MIDRSIEQVFRLKTRFKKGLVSVGIEPFVFGRRLQEC